MIHLVTTTVLLLGSLLTLTEGVCKTDALTAEEKAVLDAHNKVRALHVGTEPLCYGVTGDDITFTAQSWTDTIAGDKAMKHSSGGSYGENLATAGTTGTVLEKSPAYEQSTDMWYEEIQYWDYTTNAKKVSAPDNKATGHFTAVVWKNTKQVNCGYATYTNEYNNYMVTCQYYPPGNYNSDYANQVAPLKSSEKTTCNKPTVANGAVSPDTATVEEGQKYTVTCSGGSILEGNVNTFTCGADGNVTPASITCKAAEQPSCNKPTVANAVLSPATATVLEGAKYTVTCSEGHILEGNVNTFTCGADGNVTPASLTCKAADKNTCNKPTVENGVLTPDTATVAVEGSYTVKCSDGYKLKGDVDTLKCGGDGGFTPTSLTCDKESGAGRVALSALLVAAVAVLLQ